MKWTQLQLANEGDARAQTARHLRAEIGERDDAIRHLTAQLHQSEAAAARLRRPSRPRHPSTPGQTASVGCQTELPPLSASPRPGSSRPPSSLSRLGQMETAALVRPAGRGRRPSAAVSLPPIELNQSVGVTGGRALIRQQLRLAVDRGTSADSF